MRRQPHTPAETALLSTLIDEAALIAVMSHTKERNWIYGSMPALVLAQGVWFPATEATRWQHPNMKRGQCFMNAFTAVDWLLPEGHMYVEGYASTPHTAGPPIFHAWAITPDGRPVEVTWNEPGAAYLGIVFEMGFVRRTISAREKYGVIDNWEKGWPLLKNGLPPDARPPSYHDILNSLDPAEFRREWLGGTFYDEDSNE